MPPPCRPVAAAMGCRTRTIPAALLPPGITRKPAPGRARRYVGRVDECGPFSARAGRGPERAPGVKTRPRSARFVYDLPRLLRAPNCWFQTRLKHFGHARRDFQCRGDQGQWCRPSIGLISFCMARHARSRPAHIHGSPFLDTRHCLTSLGLGSKCNDQEMPPQEKLQSNGCRQSSQPARGRTGTDSVARINRCSARTSGAALVAGR